MGKLGARAVDKRMRFVTAAEAGQETMTALCRRFGLSRKTGYKWLARYRLEGIEGLIERSRAPHTHAQLVTAAVAECCLAVRRAHRSWGPVKVRAWLERDEPEVAWPAASTIGELFDREGLTIKPRLRRRAPPSSAPFAACGDANAVWCIDFKGWFLTGDGTHCEPLTLSDAYSRYLLRCQPLGRTDSEHVWPVLDAAFVEFGLPLRLRSDNGPPFASTGAGGLSRLAVKVIKAGGSAGTHCPRQTAAERPARAAPPDPAGRYRQPAGAQPARAARAVPHLSAGLQRGAAACRARQCQSGRALQAVATTLGRRLA